MKNDKMSNAFRTVLGQSTLVIMKIGLYISNFCSVLFLIVSDSSVESRFFFSVSLRLRRCPCRRLEDCFCQVTMHFSY